jgi:hypothetical protein
MDILEVINVELHTPSLGIEKTTTGKKPFSQAMSNPEPSQEEH